MNKKINNGVYPTMLIAYTDDNKIDYTAMGELIEWYIDEGVHGIFALCHSTEIHCLSLKERLDLAEFVIKTVNGRVSVVIGGITADTIEEQIKEALLFAELKPDALVLISNRLCVTGENDLIDNLKKMFEALPSDLPLGVYECPHPYKRIINDDEFEFIAKSGRIVFIKDTCCDVEMMKRRAKIAENTPFKLFNANCATFLETLTFGYDGFSGIMANFHPALYSWMYENSEDLRCKKLNTYLGITSLIEMRCYPIPAKRYLKKYVGLNISDYCRSVKDKTVPALSSELEAVYDITKIAEDMIN